MLVFDLETDGLENYSQIYTLTIYDTEAKTYETYDQKTVQDGVKRLSEAGCVCGHNIIFFDLPAIRRLYPKFIFSGKILDTLVWSRLVYPDIVEVDKKNYKKWKMPSRLIGSHSLEAWGYRLGEYKDSFGETADWSEWSQEMSDYCRQDVTVTVKLLEKLQAKEVSQEALELEHEVAKIIQRQIAYGFLFDERKAQQLYVKLLQRKQELTDQLRSVFKPWQVIDKIFTPKRDNKKLGYKAGVQVTKYKTIEFNPGSRHHVAYQLQKLYGWKPSEFTNSGQPKIDEDILKALPYPEANLLAEYYMIEKRIGQLAEGDKAWLKMIKEDGRIHGDVITNGAVTGRMTHNNPNVAQVPAIGVPFGKECRELFCVPEGKLLVGCDAAALELRCLAHYMAPYDGGAYGKAAIEGKKEDGTDIHTLNMKALGITSRDKAKTWFYAYIYGAGDYKLGTILSDNPKLNAKQLATLGKRSRAKFEKNLPALKKLQEKVKQVFNERGYLIGLDGRQLKVRSEHSALNTLLQSAGAIVMKKALVILDSQLQQQFVPGKDYEFVANIHDEFELEVSAPFAELIGSMAKEAIRQAGEYFKFRCPLDGEFSIGKNWAETH